MKYSRFMFFVATLFLGFIVTHNVRAGVVLSNLGETIVSTLCTGMTSPSGYGFKTGTASNYTLDALTITIYGRPATIYFDLYSDDAGEPGTLISSIGSTVVTDNTTTYFDFRFDTNIPLTGNTTYWIVYRADTGFCYLPQSSTPPSGEFTAIPTLLSSDDGATWAGRANYAVYALEATPLEEAPAEFVPVPAFSDGRINDYDKGNPVVLYPTQAGGLIVYDTDGLTLLLVTPDEIAAVPECPDMNTLIAENPAVGVSFWRLAGSCYYQVNAPTAEAGKIYTIIFSELYSGAGYTSFEYWE